MKPKGGVAKCYLGLLLATVACTGGAARAAAPLGFYVGAEIDRTRLNIDVPSALGIPSQLLPFTGPLPLRLDDAYTHGTLLVGFRPVSLLGAELKYIDFGHETGIFTENELQYGFDARARALALFGVLYVPQPVNFIDLYGKVGAARLQSEFSGNVNIGNLFTLPCSSPGVVQPYGFCTFASSGIELRCGWRTARESS